jgi:peptidoglycan-N-acetylglucosamine deacetylase
MTNKYILGLIGLLVVFLMVSEENQPSKEIVYSIQTHKKVVALTFDDGPHPIYTYQLLDILNKYHVKATFFMVGASMKKYPLIVKQVVAKGHSIGNHTYTHPFNMAACSKAQINKELTNCQATIKKLVGQRSFIFRPPRGLFNKKVVEIARKNGYLMVLWSICGDSRRAKSPELMARMVTKSIHNGDIILLHDGTFDSRWKDVEATQLIIEALLKKGYQFVTIPQLLEYYGNGSKSKQFRNLGRVMG